MDTVRVHLSFRAQTKYGELKDTLIFSESEWQAITQKDIDEMKAQRVEASEKNSEYPQIPPEEPSKDALLIQKAELESMLDAVNLKINKADSKG